MSLIRTLACAFFMVGVVSGFAVVSCRRRCSALRDGWSAVDDWSRLSSESRVLDSGAIFNMDIGREAAKALEEKTWRILEEEEEDCIIEDAIDVILHGEMRESETPLYDTKEEEVSVGSYLEEASKEIGLLVRCNQRPQELLIQEGRALAPLEEHEKYNVGQLFDSNSLQPTSFLTQSVSRIFNTHCDDDRTMNAESVSKWMSKCLGQDVGRHDKRVTRIISQYGVYGTGVLTQDGLLKLYTNAVQHSQTKTILNKQLLNLELSKPTVESVWRDFDRHGIVPPVVKEREALQNELNEKMNIPSSHRAMDTLMDECEILDWGESSSQEATDDSSSSQKSSHELVPLAFDGKTPKRMRDGEFVFIDEESCIGCRQCVNICPSAFVMLDSGRARTFHQTNTPDAAIAISSCPVNCMHRVAFHELKEMELARDSGNDDDGMDGFRRHTPLYVSRTLSDANRKSSWYHHLKSKCSTSKSCPQRGCYKCPQYSTPGANPYFQKRHREAENIRAREIIESGEADMFRNFVDL